MKSLIFFGTLLFGAGLACPGLAQTAAQYIEAGNQFYAAKSYDQAAKNYQAAIQADPHSAIAYQGLGNCDYLLGRDNEALAAYEEVLSLDPNNLRVSNFVQTLRAKTGTSPSAVVSTAGLKPMPSNGGAGMALDKSFEWEVMGGVGIATGSSGPTTNGGSLASLGLGFGAGTRAGFRLDRNLTLGGTFAFYTYGASYTVSLAGLDAKYGNSVDSLEVLASLKCRVGGARVRPYFVVGGGFSDLMSNVSVSASGSVSGFGSISVPPVNFSASSFAPMVQGGAGVEFPAGPDMNLFAEVKFEMIFGNGGTISAAGINTNVINGSTFTHIPIDVGASFDL